MQQKILAFYSAKTRNKDVFFNKTNYQDVIVNLMF